MGNSEAVMYTQVVFKITMSSLENVPTEFNDEIKEWVKFKAVQLGLGHHIEYYYVDDDVRNDIQVDFVVEIDKK